jgi:hypothetical protein
MHHALDSNIAAIIVHYGLPRERIVNRSERELRDDERRHVQHCARVG